jgi:trk system potassium uptake protein TrkH
MNRRTIQQLIGILLMAFSITLIPPIAVSLITQDGQARDFLASFALTLFLGAALWLPVRRQVIELRIRDGFVVVSMFWTVMSLCCAIPFLFSPHLNLTDAIFESVSGFTTTGATVILGLDELPPSILYYRQQLQWLGGMGIVVLAVAVIPMLGIGGMQLYKAETPGPMKDEKITPRIAETARALWYIYLGLTVACGVAYWLVGMSAFDALCHSFTTIATGGFSTHDTSLAYFESPAIEAVAGVFMVLGGMSFAVHFMAFRARSLQAYLTSPEILGFLGIIVVLIVIVTGLLLTTEAYDGLVPALRFGSFQVVSMITTTGYTTAPFAQWPSVLPIIFIYISYIGGCAGSTAGGMKVVRVLILLKQVHRGVVQQIHPRAHVALKLGAQPVNPTVIDGVWAFFVIYVFTTVALTTLMIACGLDVVTAYSAVSTCLNVTGPALGDVAASFATMSPIVKWISIFAMLLGRLEIYTLFVVLTPMFWTY